MLGPTIDRIGETKVMDVPVGKGILISAFLGISDALTTSVGALLRLGTVGPLVSGAVLSKLVRVPAIKKIFGDRGSELFSATLIASPVDELLRVSDRLKGVIARVVPGAGLAGVPTPTLAAAPVETVSPEPTLGQPAAEGLLTELERKVRAISL